MVKLKSKYQELRERYSNYKEEKEKKYDLIVRTLMCFICLGAASFIIYFFAEGYKEYVTAYKYYYESGILMKGIVVAPVVFILSQVLIVVYEKIKGTYTGLTETTDGEEWSLSSKLLYVIKFTLVMTTLTTIIYLSALHPLYTIYNKFIGSSDVAKYAYEFSIYLILAYLACRIVLYFKPSGIYKSNKEYEED